MKVVRARREVSIRIRRIRCLREDITGLFPLGAIVLIVRGLADRPDGAWGDKFRVGFGVYDDKMDEKIAPTRAECEIRTSLIWSFP